MRRGSLASTIVYARGRLCGRMRRVLMQAWGVDCPPTRQMQAKPPNIWPNSFLLRVCQLPLCVGPLFSLLFSLYEGGQKWAGWVVHFSLF